MKCRGEKCREELVKKYTITPRSHTKLLNGQKKKSCTGDLLTDSYYSFEFISKSDSTDVGGFLCGSHAAAHFLQLINKPELPLFNPLTSPTNSPGSRKHKEGSKGKVWNPIALELYNAINLLIICWDKPIYGKLAKIKSETEKFYYVAPFDWKVKQVNKIIGKDVKKRSLTEMIQTLTSENPNLKHYSFGSLDEILDKHEMKSNF